MERVQRIKYSVIVLLEETNPEFHLYVENLLRMFRGRGEPFEILLMANGMEGYLRNKLRQVRTSGEQLKAFAMGKRTPQAVCLKAGFSESAGEIIVVCGSYRQIDDASFHLLLDALDGDADIVSPWRRHRVDPPFSQFQSRLFNGIVRKIVGTDLHDLSCTVRVFRRSVLEEVELYGNLCRFLPVIGAQKGFRNREVPCRHHEERGKTGFYSLSDYVARGIDILTLYFNTRFSRKPLRFFSAVGVVFIMTGILLMAGIFFQKLFMGVAVGGRPLLVAAVLFMVFGIQVASVGLLGVIVAFTHGRLRKAYNIDKII